MGVTERRTLNPRGRDLESQNAEPYFPGGGGLGVTAGVIVSPAGVIISPAGVVSSPAGVICSPAGVCLVIPSDF